MGAALVIGGAALACTPGAGHCSNGQCSAAFISREHPDPGSEASATALRTCEQQVDPATLELARGSVGLEPKLGPALQKESAEGLATLMNPLSWLFAQPPITGEMKRGWTPTEAEARERARQQIGQCMEDQRWVYCQWYRDRTGFAFGYRGPGWLCRRRHLDDPGLP